MSNTIDNRVVQMNFDNKQFESGVKTTVASLDTLKKGLNFDESAKSLINLSNVTKTFNLASMAENIQNISNRFSNFGIVGMSVINNLTTAIMGFGEKLLRSVLGIDQMKAGFSSYETKIDAVKTVMAGTGETIDEVTKSLNDLNTYSDRTIYSFQDMTSNISKFTNAGLSSKDAATAIMGISNVAAISGASAQEAARAMYNFGQAMQQGSVRLMDWKSIENANMATIGFKQQLIDTAVAMGMLKKGTDGVYKTLEGEVLSATANFNGSLEKQWLTTKVLTQTLADYASQNTEIGKKANAAATEVSTFTQMMSVFADSLKTSWTKTWEIIFGDFYEAKDFFTYISNSIGGILTEFANARNVPLQGWKNFGGQKLAVESFKNVLNSLLSVMDIFKTAWSEIFPKNPNLAGFGLFKITLAIRDFTKNLKMGSDTALRVKAIFRGLFAIFDIGKMAITALLGPLMGINTKGFKPFLENLLIHIALLGVWTVRLRDSIKANNTFGKAMEKVVEFVKKAKIAIQDFITKAVEGFERLKTFVISTKQAIQKFVNDIRPPLVKLGSVLEPFKKSFQSAFDFKKIKLDGATSLVSDVKDRFKPLEALKTFVTNIFGGLVKFLEKAGPTLSKVGTDVGNFLGNITSAIGKGVGTIDFNKVFAVIAGGLLGSLVLAIRNFVNKGSGVLEGVSGMFSGITGILDGVRGSLEAYQKNIQSKTLLNIAIAVGILAASLLVLSLIDSKKLLAATAAITIMFADLTGSISLMNKFGGPGGSAKLTASLIGMSIAILLLTIAVKSLAGLDKGELETSLIALSAITVGLTLFSSQIGKNTKGFIQTAFSLILIGIALDKIVKVIKDIGTVKPEVVKNGLIAIGATLAELTIFMKLTSADKMGVSKGLGLALMAKGIVLLSTAVEKFGNMDIKVLKQGLLTLGAILIGLGAFVKLTANGGNLVTTGAGMIILAGGLLILAFVIEKMGNLTWDEIGRGLGTLAGALLLISLAMYAMQGALPGAVALLIISGALAIFVPLLKILGAMKIQEIAIALGVLAGIFLILGVAGYALAPIVPILIALGVAMALIGVGIGLIGAGMMAFSAGLATLAVSGVAGALAFVTIVTTLLGLIPIMIAAFVGGIILFATLITKAVPAIGAALLALLLTLCDIVIKATPALSEALIILLLSAIQVIRTVVPAAVDAILYLIGELLRSLAEKIPEFTQSAFDILLGFLKGIRDNIGEVVTVVGEIVTEFLNALALKIPDIIQAGFNLLVSFIEGITKAISSEDNKATLGTAITNLANAIIKGLTDGLLGGIGGIVEAIGKISSGIIDALKTLLGIASPSKVMFGIAKNTVQGFVKGLVKNSGNIIDATELIGNKAVSGMSAAISRINDTLNNNLDINPTIYPILDLTDIISGGKDISNILGNANLNLLGSMNRLAITAGISDNKINGQINQPGTQGNIITFNQTNTSPKALSQFDIYRNTRNQLLMLKGLVVT